MSTAHAESIIKQLSWRYATKKFDPSRTLSDDQWNTLEKAMVLAPSSYGLQPWRFYLIQTPGVRAQLREAAWNQSQVTDASHLVVFARNVHLSAADVERHVNRVAEVRKAPKESLTGFRDMMLGSVNNPSSLPGGSVDVYTARQCYIALGFLLSAAAMIGVDACPMEGFDPVKFDEILGLRKHGYAATVMAAVGYRAADDWLAALPKVRFAATDVVVRV